MACSESGFINEASTPVSEKGNGPSSFRHAQSPSCRTSAGTCPTQQTTESSSSVRVTEKKGPRRAQLGTSEPAGSWQTANEPGNRENFNEWAGTLVSALYT